MDTDPRLPETLGEAVRCGEVLLVAAGSPSARFDSELIAEFVFRCDRTALLRDSERRLTVAEQSTWASAMAAREQGRPIAQILGEWEFYSLPLFVTPDVLVPRPETELLIDWAKEIAHVTPVSTVLDMGTGSGCIAVALANELPAVQVVAVDSSAAALAVARRNVERHGLTDRVRLCHGDLFEPLAASRHDLIVCNPPYIEPGDPALEENVRRFEPDAALHDRLDGDGLGYYRRLARDSGQFLVKGGQLLMEVGETQADDVVALFDGVQWDVEVRTDLAGIRRAVGCRWQR